eukprot:jgi/Chrpa1/20331/Chrysochromulina_OHIO_Genome00022397-RA
MRTTMAQQTGARAAVAPPMMALAIWVLDGRLGSRVVKGQQPELCVEHSSKERRWMSDEAGGADVRD